MVEEFWHRKIGIAVTCSCWILLVFFTVQFFHGSWDIYNTYAKCMARDRLAKEQIAAGEKNLTLPVVIPETEYAALKGLADWMWPISMYGIMQQWLRTIKLNR